LQISDLVVTHEFADQVILFIFKELEFGLHLVHMALVSFQEVLLICLQSRHKVNVNLFDQAVQRVISRHILVNDLLVRLINIVHRGQKSALLVHAADRRSLVITFGFLTRRKVLCHFIFI
jgi:hypothetical protein